MVLPGHQKYVCSLVLSRWNSATFVDPLINLINQSLVGTRYKSSQWEIAFQSVLPMHGNTGFVTVCKSSTIVFFLFFSSFFSFHLLKSFTKEMVWYRIGLAVNRRWKFIAINSCQSFPHFFYDFIAVFSDRSTRARTKNKYVICKG